MARIAVDITHPAHFHFFKNAIYHWQQAGDEVLILSRDKDLTLQLLEEAGLMHRQLSRARGGLAGLALELAHNWRRASISSWIIRCSEDRAARYRNEAIRKRRDGLRSCNALTL